MKNLKEYIKEGLFDGIDNIENTNGLDNASKGFEQMDKEKIIEWICGHYARSVNYTWKSLPLTKSQIKIDLKTDPPTVNYRGSLVVKTDKVSSVKYTSYASPSTLTPIPTRLFINPSV